MALQQKQQQHVAYLGVSFPGCLEIEGGVRRRYLSPIYQQQDLYGMHHPGSVTLA